MGSQAGSWPRVNTVNPHCKTPAMQQVKLHLDVHPPVLDTSGPKAPTSYQKPRGGMDKNFIGMTSHFWNSLCSMYNSVCSPRSPVTWVTPEMVQPAALPYGVHPQLPYHCRMEVNNMYDNRSRLWFPATAAGSQVEFVDPLLMWQNTSFPCEWPPSSAQLQQKVCRPLNPEAKEWIPKEYAKDSLSSSTLPCKTMDQDCLKAEEPTSFDLQDREGVDGLPDFCEITDCEIQAIRLGESDNSNVTQKENPSVEDDVYEIVEANEGFSENNSMKAAKDNSTKTAPVDLGFAVMVDSHPSEGHTTTAAPVDLGFAVMIDSHPIQGHTSFDQGVIEIQACDNIVKDSRPVSYASVVGKLPVSSAVDKSQQNCVRSGPADQSIPHIFIRDKKYPKEKASPVDDKSKAPLLFKSVTKDQKKCSRNFLRELKESSPVKGKMCGSTGNERDSGFKCSILEVSSRPRLCPKSPTCSVEPPQIVSPKDKSLPTLRVAPHSLSERSSCNTSHDHSESNFSIMGVESVDVDIGKDVVDRHCDIYVLPEKSEPQCVKKPKYSSNILAHILGCDESESEDSDEDSEDSDSDWDSVCVESTDNFDLDDTWETFGLCLTLPQVGKSSVPASVPEQGVAVCSPVKSICDTVSEEDPTFTGVTLEEINKRWEEEIQKDVLGSREKKVKFGEVKIHPIVAWDFAYKMARRGPWEMYARDRMRFQHRIAALEPIISPVLQASHREAHYQQQQRQACCLS